MLKYGNTGKWNCMILYHTCLYKCINDEWSYITSIHSKGTKLDCNNYRGLSVTSTVQQVGYMEYKNIKGYDRAWN